ncbi:hypothetical protein [Geminicoccus harenae]|uniref:hypothetical protein n=1 Tax=Geminicoccus harenae TaxID=2498453 RepID=UPI00168AC139|nr:hypothetical protein [Geminicoccus harenae]
MTSTPDTAAFLASLDGPAPPDGLAPALRAVWFGLADRWDEAHGIAQEHEGQPDADWVHAWLHRVEGDLGNAGYWYRRAGRPVAQGDLAAEGRAIVESLISRA